MISGRNFDRAHQNRSSSRLSLLAKRAIDIVASLVGLILLLPLFGVVALLIKWDSPGPVFFRGKRAARGGGTFDILKFRTMHERPESYQGPKITGRDDPRISTRGRWLRETKLNELPQLWNVLKGEMSLVGPRPEDPDIVLTWPDAVRREILSMRPGITSPASVQFRNEEELLGGTEVLPEYLKTIVPSKLRLDQLYVRHRSLLLDWDVIFWTLIVVMPRLGAFQPPEEHLFRGPVSHIVRHHVSWFSIDVVITFSAFGLSGVFWRTLGPLDIGLTSAITISIAFTILFSTTAALLGVNRIAWSKASAIDVFDLAPGILVASAVILVTNGFMQSFPQRTILLACGLAGTGIVIARYYSPLRAGLATRWLTSGKVRPPGRERVLIVGGGAAGQLAAAMLTNGPGVRSYHTVGFVDDDLAKRGLRIRGVKVLGPREAIPSLVEQHDVGIIIFAIHNTGPKDRHALLDVCYKTQARVFLMPDLLSRLGNIATPRQQKMYAPSAQTLDSAVARVSTSGRQAWEPPELQSWASFELRFWVPPEMRSWGPSPS